MHVFSSARLSGTDPDDEELEEVEELERLTSLADQSLWTRLKKMVHDLVERVGFFGILVCASVSKYSRQLFCVMVPCIMPYHIQLLTNYKLKVIPLYCTVQCASLPHIILQVISGHIIIRTLLVAFLWLISHKRSKGSTVA